MEVIQNERDNTETTRVSESKKDPKTRLQTDESEENQCIYY